MAENGVVTAPRAHAARGGPVPAEALTGAGAGLVALVLVGAAEDRWIVFAVAAIAAFVVAARCRPSWCVLPAAFLIGTSAWLFTQTVEVPLLLGIGVALGVCAGILAAPGRSAAREARAARVVGASAASSALLILGVDVFASSRTALATGAGVAAFVAVFAVATDGAFRRAPRAPSIVAITVALVMTVSMTFWIGANAATATWFGGLVYHGPRTGNEVALTFDDGPNATTTLALSRILDRYGVKATFFEVGKAVAQRPDITRALLADGQLVGNHSYHHDEWRWLDPRYPELARTQRAIDRVAGVCPSYYRPPHGQHTPLMAEVVHAHHMKMVTWDDSTSDWTTQDGARVARRILAKVKPGSIIDLHDGLDGKVNVDRTVLVRALPLILDGLRARGLHAVRLDVLLGGQPYAGRCS